jgi:hypothetical protein
MDWGLGVDGGVVQCKCNGKIRIDILHLEIQELGTSLPLQ